MAPRARGHGPARKAVTGAEPWPNGDFNTADQQARHGAARSLLGSPNDHRLCIVGANETDMAAAINRMGEIEGGFAVVEGGKVIAELRAS